MTEGMGKEVVCKHCNQPFKVGEKRPPQSWKIPDLGLDTWIGIEPPDEEAEEERVVHCIMCDAPLKPGTTICTDCGANQITGVVQRHRYREPEPQRKSIGSILPTRWIAVLMLMAAIGAGGIWVIIKIAHSINTATTEVTDVQLVNSVRERLAAGDDLIAIQERFGGWITDENLPRFVRKLLADKESVARATQMLVGCGLFKDLQPILALAEEDVRQRPRVAAVLNVIGERRLIQLSCDDDEAIRKAAVDALRYFLPDHISDNEVFARLMEPTRVADKQDFYNRLGRPWPEATGTFVAEVQGVQSDFQIHIQQFGQTFYCSIGTREFRSNHGGGRNITISIDRWCEATGQVVDPEAVRDLLGGTVRLSSPVGAGWKGTIELVLRQPTERELPGFLPFEVQKVGESMAVPVRLIRP
jgi:hypothetical protein